MDAGISSRRRQQFCTVAVKVTINGRFLRIEAEAGAFLLVGRDAVIGYEVTIWHMCF